MYNLLVGGAAGDGIETMASVLEKTLKKSGCHVFSIRDFMSRIRGGHNFVQIRFGNQPIAAHRDALDGIIAVNEESFSLHKDRLRADGFLLCDASLNIDDKRAIKLNINEIAKSLGNSKVSGSVVLGAVLKLFGKSLQDAEEALSASLKTALLEINLSALREGYKLVTARFKPNPVSLEEHILISGNTALALGALAAGLKFYSAYPMSPSTSILEYLSDHAESMGVAVEQAEDEIAAINMVLGASYAGARSMVGTSGGGFSLMAEALGFAGIAEIPVVIVDAQRPGPATGFPTRTEQSDLKFVVSASQGEFPRLVIAVKDHADAFYQSARALELAEKYQIPVILLTDQYLADSSATPPIFDLQKINKNTWDEKSVSDGVNYRTYLLTECGISPRPKPGKTKSLVCIDSDEHDEYGNITESAQMRVQMVDKRMSKLNLLKDELIEPDFLGDSKFDTLLVGFGSTYGAIAEALSILNAENNKKYAALVFGDVCPLPTKRLTQYALQAKEIINVEQNATGQLASLLRDAALIACHRSVLKYDGRQLSVDDIVKGVKRNP